jgi:uncharacterized protein (TIGR03067 family)
MKTTIGFGVLAALLAVQTSDLKELIRKDRERLQGTWKIIAAESKGEKVLSKDLGELFLIFDGDSIQVEEDKKKQDRYSFRLNPERKPKEIDFSYTKGPKNGRTDRAIYLFQGDRLTFCIQEDATQPRPKNFNTEPDTAFSLVVLERVKK